MHVLYIYYGKLITELADKTDVDGFISLEDFTAHISPKAFSDWKKHCGIATGCSVEIPSIPNYMELQNNARITPLLFIYAVLLIYFISFKTW
ncbi:hypothetical protein ANCCAN_25251 [Ancylostoma caninum]|uniref:Uncharacterized protein n=1 Tax=Ancylostoma caninum TaxID=29170 RepID=A0A368FA16_ANCCA|nr:hypothetical protein ANCCAN_25251 [Ancylostoma caninum]